MTLPWTLIVLPITELGEQVEEEVEVAAGGEIVLGEGQGLLAVLVRLDAVLGLVVLEVEEIRCTDRQHVIQCDSTVKAMKITEQVHKLLLLR